MASTQLSLESYFGYFVNAINHLKNDPDFTPTRADIQKGELVIFATRLSDSNNQVRLLQATLRDLRNKRNDIAFKTTSNTPGKTIEAILNNIFNYIAAENGVMNGVYKTIKVYRTKMNPGKKAKTAKGTTANSRSEKTFAALGGYLGQTIHLLTFTPNLIYQPSNPILTVANLTALHDSFIALNLAIANAERELKDARTLRQALFNGENGAKRRVTDIKAYLASYDDGKKNPKYLQFVNEFK